MLHCKNVRVVVINLGYLTCNSRSSLKEFYQWWGSFGWLENRLFHIMLALF